MQSLKHHFHSPRLGLFLIRLVAGTIFIYHGVSKLSNMEGTIGFFASLGFGAFLAWLVAFIELLGGISLIIGLWSRLFAGLLAVIMIVAIFGVSLSKGFVANETHLMLLATMVAVLFSGCGRYSVCAWDHKECKDCESNGRCGCQHGMN